MHTNPIRVVTEGRGMGVSKQKEGIKSNNKIREGPFTD